MPPTFVDELRSTNVRPHVAQNLDRRYGPSAIDGCTTRHPAYAASQRIRERIEEGFGWMKAVAELARPKLRGVDRVGWAFPFRQPLCHAAVSPERGDSQGAREPSVHYCTLLRLLLSMRMS